MEESNIDVKHILDRAIKEAVRQVQNFTQDQLKNLIKLPINQQRPLIIPINDRGYIVGNYAVKHYKNYWYVKYFYNDKEEIFGNRQSALLYALSQTKKQYSLADNILQYDKDVERLEIEVNLFQQRLKHAKQSKNAINADIYASRLGQVRHLLHNKKILLAKSLKTAKYYYL